MHLYSLRKYLPLMNEWLRGGKYEIRKNFTGVREIFGR
jgi:hypothetical protein